MPERSKYRDDLKSQVFEFTDWWEDFLCYSLWSHKNKLNMKISDIVFYSFDGLKFACCLIKGHDYGPANNCYGPREHCWFCYMSKPGTTINRRNRNNQIARHWPLKPKEIK